MYLKIDQEEEGKDTHLHMNYKIYSLIIARPEPDYEL